jgi:low affinity Fe/Cu permease
VNYLRSLRTRFYRFAGWAQRVIGSPEHLALFFCAILIWLVYSYTQHWSTFSALVMNDYSTIAEYVFEILILAAALDAAYTAAAKGDAMLEKMHTLLDLILALLKHLQETDDDIDTTIHERLTHIESQLETLLQQWPSSPSSPANPSPPTASSTSRSTTCSTPSPASPTPSSSANS